MTCRPHSWVVYMKILDFKLKGHLTVEAAFGHFGSFAAEAAAHSAAMTAHAAIHSATHAL